jgi:archaellum component FlaC
MGLKWDYNNGQQIGATGLYAKGFHGYMNYVNMFGRALTASDIAVLYNTPGYTQSTINRGLMTLGIENEPGAVFNDRIALMPANGSGFVGINTKTPTCALDVSGSINAGGDLNFTGPYAANGKTPKIQFNVTNLGKAYINCIGGPTGSEVNNTRLQFVVAASSESDIEALTINTKTGNVGIGTKNPGSTLDVSGNINTNNRIKLSNNGYYGEIYTNTSANQDLTLYNSGTGWTYISTKNTSNAFVMNKDGYAAFNKDPSSYRLDVNGDVNASSYNAGSDYRIKTNVKPLDASFNIDVLKPVTYTNTRHGRQDVGFIAHEVQEHYPFLVTGEKDGEQIQSLNYSGLIGLLTKEIQDLKRRLAETEAKVASVETNVRTIETKVEEVDDIIISVEDKVLNVENKVSSVENKVSSVENTVQKVENTVLLEQARLTICETEIALNKSAIKDLDERLQS